MPRLKHDMNAAVQGLKEWKPQDRPPVAIPFFSFRLMVGIGVVFVLAARTATGRITVQYHTPLEIGGLYWHFVDIVWVFLYAIFYIPGLHK